MQYGSRYNTVFIIEIPGFVSRDVTCRKRAYNSHAIVCQKTILLFLKFNLSDIFDTSYSYAAINTPFLYKSSNKYTSSTNSLLRMSSNVSFNNP